MSARAWLRRREKAIEREAAANYSRMMGHDLPLAERLARIKQATANAPVRTVRRSADKEGWVCGWCDEPLGRLNLDCPVQQQHPQP